MTEQELQIELMKARDATATERAKINRFLRFMKSYEQDMDFTPVTDLECNMKDCMQQIFDEAHKLLN